MKKAQTKKAFGQKEQPTNAGRLGGLKAMLQAIKHIGRPEAGGSPPFSKK